MNEITYAAANTLTQTTNPVVTFNFEPIEKYGIALYNKTTGEYKSNILETDLEQIIELANTSGMTSALIDSAVTNAMNKVNIYLYKTSDNRVLGIQIDPTDDIGSFQSINTTFKYNGSGVTMKINCGDVPEYYNLYMLIDIPINVDNILRTASYSDVNKAFTNIGVDYRIINSGHLGLYNQELYNIQNGQLTTSWINLWVNLNYIHVSCTVGGEMRRGWLLQTDIEYTGSTKDSYFVISNGGNSANMYVLLDSSTNYSNGWAS